MDADPLVALGDPARRRDRTRVAVILGTRPEAIKLAPVIREMRSRQESFECTVVATGQHSEMVKQAFDDFGLIPDVDLAVMVPNQSLAALTSRLFSSIDQFLTDAGPDWVIVQGDTTSAYVAAMCAFYRRINIAHVEAGLRTGDRWAPFPEEVNRVLVARLASVHFAPTLRSADNLRREGIADETIFVTGNTSIDALLWMRERVTDATTPAAIGAAPQSARRMILVTGHRRESFGDGLVQICEAIRDLSDAFPDIEIVYPVHLNPNVRGPVFALLADHPRVSLIEPVGYADMVRLMNRAFLVLTDSGGLQEEVPGLGKPVLVMRETTERPEAVESGCAVLVGTDRKRIVSEVTALLTDPVKYAAYQSTVNPFGDGTAARQIVDVLEQAGP